MLLLLLMITITTKNLTINI